MKIWSELRRREVLRMAAMYVVTAWLVMQIAEVVIALAELPGRYGGTVIIVLLIGLPIALVLSWFLDATPSGVRLESNNGDAPPASRSRTTGMVIIAILVVALALFSYIQLNPPMLEQSVAVLPFDDLATDTDQDGFADGMAVEILHRLTTFENLRVIARNSSFQTQDMATAAIASRLNVGYLLRGSVRRSGDDVRITASLVNTRRDESVWSQSYDADLSVTDLFEVQVDIARAIAGELRAVISSEAESQMAQAPTQSTEAYRLYLLGRQRLDQGRIDALREAAEFLERAIEVDPAFAEPRIALVHAYFRLRNRVRPDVAKWQELIESAIALNDQLGEAYAAQAAYVITNDATLDKRRFERALKLSPGSAFVHEMYADYLREQLSDCSNALKLYRRGSELDPLNANLHFGTARAHYCLNQWEQSRLAALQAIDVDPSYSAAYQFVAWLYARTEGALDQAMLWFRRAHETDPANWVTVLNIARRYIDLGDFDAAKRWLMRLLKDDHDWDPRQVGKAARIDLVRIAHFTGLHIKESAVSEEDPFAIEHLVAAGSYDDALTLMREAAPDYFETGDPEDIPNPFDAILIATLLDRTGGLEEAAALWISVENLLLQKMRNEPAFLGASGMAVRSLAHACEGKYDLAMELLSSAFENRWRVDWRLILGHPCFEELKNDARFISIRSSFEADMARQLDNVREMERNGEIPPLASTEESQ